MKENTFTGSKKCQVPEKQSLRIIVHAHIQNYSKCFFDRYGRGDRSFLNFSQDKTYAIQTQT